MHPSVYLPDGQDANHHSFVQGVPPYFIPSHETEARFNCEDLDVGSFSGDDDIEEYDSNAQLRSQQLNSDGTPKRPMNAFMIFARKRRPMVSSEQPTMRTGEISKILSKEWSEMSKENKQFYLDQAKKLKDTFNTRWPDYVYRRRPNNSRKRRKVGGTSNVGPGRSHDAANNSDEYAEPLVDPNASGQSGDESRSQSTDTFPSPLSAQHNVLYRTPELGPTRSLDRSPTPASALAAYTAPAPSPFIPNGFVDGSAFNGYTRHDHPCGENGDHYYKGPGLLGINTSVTELDPKMQGWDPCGGAPSGLVVAAPSCTPPASRPLVVTPGLPQLAYPHDPGNWSKEAGNDVPGYETQPLMWRSSPSIPGHHGVDRRGVTGSLPSSMNLVGPNALEMRPYGNHKSMFDESLCPPAYIEGNQVHQGYHSPISLPAFRGELTAPHDPTYFEPRR
ncbi:Transcription factor SOX-10 [Sus scrofa] [Rhizoctonia solani]|uniref:Transcription factor SOX-10 [Sus scrofa] n=1 Tax=Rhizoctonia solani TaxID=456999 RepID=A0A0K6G3T5_9AGAM|nr:Transcription factor SOX-10 [Sus scrofa] [Rhizoctonia solani]